MSTADNIAKTAGIGMLDVARHMLEHHLPAPKRIEAPTAAIGENAIRVSVSSFDLGEWLASITVDAETHVPASVPGFTHSSYAGRLPSGIRVLIKCARRSPATPLTVVPA